MLVSLLSGCGEGQSLARPEYHFEESLRFGWSDVSDADRELSPTEQLLQGAVLGAVGGIAVGPREQLYVLDRTFGKLVVFRRDGGLERIFQLPQGEGPGEFERLRSVAVDQSGRIIFLDGGNRRVTEFLPDGSLGRMELVREGTPYEIHSIGENIAITLQYRAAGDPAVLIWDSDWKVATTLFPVSDEEAAHAAFGEWDAFDLSLDGELRFAPIVPGSWRNAEGSSVGLPLVPNATGQLRSTGTRYFPIKIRAMTTLEDGSVAQHYWVSRSEDHPEFSESRDDRRLLHLAPDGRVIADVPWPGPEDSYLIYSSPASNEFFVGVSRPFPQVVKYRLEVRSARGGT